MGEGKQELQEMSTIEYRMPQPLSLDAVEDLLPRWKKFKQQFQIFLTAAGFERLSESRKAAILLNCIGADAQELYFNILSKDEDSQKYEEVLKAFDDYFTPKQNEVINAFIFNNRKQEEGESFDNFYTQIKKLVKNCAYNDMEDRMLRDRIVMGISDKNLQQKLLEVNDLTLDKAVNRCRAAELSKEHMKNIQKQAELTLSVDKINKEQGQSPNDKGAKYNKQFNKNFYHCLKCSREHGPRQCPAYGKKCNKCFKLNHFASGCKNRVQEIDKIEQLNNKDGDSEDKEL